MSKIMKSAHRDYIQNYLSDCHILIQKMPIEPIEKIIDILFDAWKKGSTVFVMGNGGSASTASHFAADLAKYPITGMEDKDIQRFKVMCLTDNMVTTSAWTNDSGFETIFAQQLEPWVKKNDVLVAFSVHGGSGRPSPEKKWSQNIPAAFLLGKKRKAKLIGFSGDTGGVISEMADACVVIPTVSLEKITPHVEGFHVVLHHLVVYRLKQLIQNRRKE